MLWLLTAFANNIGMFDIITIGSVTRDAFFKVPKFQSVSWKKTPSKKGLILPIGEKLEVDDVFFTIGGNSANASVTFSRFGLKTACVGKVGDDAGGREIRRRLGEEGVDTNMLAKTDKLATAYSVLLLKGGERTILGYHGASNLFSPKDVNREKLKAKWWYLSLSGESTKYFGEFMALAKKNKIAVAMNPSGYHLRHHRQDILKHLKDISFLVLNEGEAAILTGIPFSKEKLVFKKLDALMPGVLAVTNGDKGVTVSDGKFIYRAGIFREKKLVDRTGAGDAFGAGFTAGIMKSGGDVKYAIRLASANATATIEKLGATEGVLTNAEFRNSRWKTLKIKTEKI
ncbi:carbohydrate kinase family protein [bacterium]|nr:MAG: carbohydrate kinase family protein [bacterium]